MIDFSAEYWNYEFLGNSVESYAISLIIFLGISVAFGIFQKIILNRLRAFAKTTTTTIDDTLIKIVNSVKPPFYFFIAFYFAIKSLNFPEVIENALFVILIIWAVYQIIKAAQILIDFIFQKALLKDGQDEGTKTALKTLGKLSKGLLWVIGVLMILQNLDIDVTSLIAGLGIGGIAIALAAQNILADLFSSFAILFDKPFVPGDYIMVGEHRGTVEKIGIKTTRIRSPQGEEIVISNKELTSARIQNFRKLKERRVDFKIGVTYDTSSKKLKTIAKIVKDIIESEKLTRFDRAHFVEFGDSALIFEFIYFMKSSEFLKFRNTHQRILLKIKSAFEKEQIEMAFPSQTIYLAK